MADIPGVLGTMNRSMMVKKGTTNTAASIQIERERIEGFHCWAYGQFKELKRGDASDPLSPGSDKPIDGAAEKLNTSNPASARKTIDTNVDTRYDRYVKVSAYLQQLASHMGNRTGSAGSHTGVPPLEGDE